MKNIRLVGLGLVLLGMLSLNQVFAQTGELRVGFGFLTVPDMGNINSYEVTEGFPGYNNATVKGSGAFQVTYVFNPRDRFSFGLDAVFQALESTLAAVNQPTLTTSDSWFSVMPRANFNYLNRDALQLYGSLSVGMTFLTSSSEDIGDERFTGNAFAYQVTPIGVRIGDGFAFFAELGYGFRGMVNGGLSVRF